MVSNKHQLGTEHLLYKALGSWCPALPGRWSGPGGWRYGGGGGGSRNLNLLVNVHAPPILILINQSALYSSRYTYLDCSHLLLYLESTSPFSTGAHLSSTHFYPTTFFATVHLLYYKTSLVILSVQSHESYAYNLLNTFKPNNNNVTLQVIRPNIIAKQYSIGSPSL